MEIITTIIQILVPAGILNVWLLRGSRATAYRGGQAASLKEEFRTYGLPDAAFYLVGFLKITAALAIWAGFVVPALRPTGAAVLAFLMAGAIAMHLKIGDPAKKSLPAAVMLILSLWLVLA